MLSFLAMIKPLDPDYSWVRISLFASQKPWGKLTQSNLPSVDCEKAKLLRKSHPLLFFQLVTLG